MNVRIPRAFPLARQPGRRLGSPAVTGSVDRRAVAVFAGSTLVFIAIVSASWGTNVVWAQRDVPDKGAGKRPLGEESSKAVVEAERSPSETAGTKSVETPASAAAEERMFTRQEMLIASLTIFLLAVFVGFEVITKVPPTLHTPLMSGSNAISGITIVGALIVAGRGLGIEPAMGLIAVILATINVVGGFLVTHRMLAMFKKR